MTMTIKIPAVYGLAEFYGQPALISQYELHAPIAANFLRKCCPAAQRPAWMFHRVSNTVQSQLICLGQLQSVQIRTVTQQARLDCKLPRLCTRFLRDAMSAGWVIKFWLHVTRFFRYFHSFLFRCIFLEKFFIQSDKRERRNAILYWT